MPSYIFILAALSSTVVEVACSPPSSPCPLFPPSMLEFSAQFRQPQPPIVKPEFQTHFVQHKWNANLSHITSGYIENAPSRGFVRVDEAFDGQLASSYFDYSNVTKSGLVDNTMTTYDPKSAKSTVWRGYVNSNFPLFREDVLAEAGAVYEGLVNREFIPTPVAAWSIMYQGMIPVTVYVNECSVIVGYDYFAPELRTRVIMEFFNIQAK